MEYILGLRKSMPPLGLSILCQVIASVSNTNLITGMYSTIIIIVLHANNSDTLLSCPHTKFN